MKNTNITATTVKLDNSLYNDFKIQGIRSGSTLQDFVTKCIKLYSYHEPFRDIVNTFQIPVLTTTPTGSLLSTTITVI